MNVPDHESMERKQLIERLELMKKEFAKKQRKLEKAKRAARVKAHVKRKIQELNLQANDDQHGKQPLLPDGQTTQLALGQGVSSVTVVGEDKQQPPAQIDHPPEKVCLDTCVGKNSLSDKDILMDSAKTCPENVLSSRGNSVNQSEESDCKIETKDIFQQLKDSAMQKEERKSDNSARMRSNSNETVANQSQAVVPDSLAITPTFRSLRDTSSGCQDSLSYDQNLCPTLDKFTYIDSFANTFTLNLNSETSTPDTQSDLQLAKNSGTLGNESRCMDMCVNSAAHIPNSESKKINAIKVRKCLNKVDCPAVCTPLNTETEVVASKQKYACESDKRVTPDIKPCSVSSSVPLPALNHGSNKVVLRLQDISSEDVASQIKELSSSPSPEMAVQDCFLDYTELDAIPFSQFELTEDFLSESSLYTSDSSQSRGKTKGISALVQRKSPRLSSIEFDGNGISATEKQQGYRLGCQKVALHRMARKQKKSKRALFLSSLFQYLIDDAKRNTSFVEFTLPEVITKLASCSGKGTDAEIQSGSGKSSQCTIAEYCTADLPDTEMIPETEIIPDSESQRTSDEDSEISSGDGQHADGRCQSELAASVVKMETSAINVAQHDQDRTRTSSTEMLRLSGRSENVSQLPAYPTVLNNHFSSVHADSVHENFDNDAGHLGAKNAVCTNSTKPSTLARKSTTSKLLKLKDTAVEVLPSLDGAKAKCADARDDHVITRHDTHTAKDGNHNFTADSTDYIHHCPVGDKSLKQITCVTMDSVPSVLSSSQSQNKKEKGDEDNQKERRKPVFTPSKSRGTDEVMETAVQMETIQSKCWFRFTGCAESGCTDAVVGMIVGTVVTDSEETAFILCVQTTALTLWTMDDNWQWLAEFHWYLPKTNKAEGACRVYTADRQLTVLVWGLDMESAPCLTLTVFVYHWDTQHTQRFTLPLPSPVCPHRVFCHGLQCSMDCVLVFTSDKSYTRGKRYLLDSHHGCVSMELAMEETNTQLVDLCLVDQLPDAVAGLTVDHTVLVWNHKIGTLILSLPLPDMPLTFCRMYTCYSLQGYLLFHMTEAKDRYLCLVALNPATGACKLIKRFSTHHRQDADWLRVSTFQDILLTVSFTGTVHLWDAGFGEMALIKNTSSKIHTAVMFYAKGSCILLTGQENGCLHLFSVCK